MPLMRYKTKAEYPPAAKDLVVANALSRSPIQTNSSSPVAEYVTLHVHMVETNLLMSPQKIAEKNDNNYSLKNNNNFH